MTDVQKESLLQQAQNIVFGEMCVENRMKLNFDKAFIGDVQVGALLRFLEKHINMSATGQNTWLQDTFLENPLLVSALKSLNKFSHREPEERWIETANGGISSYIQKVCFRADSVSEATQQNWIRALLPAFLVMYFVFSRTVNPLDELKIKGVNKRFEVPVKVSNRTSNQTAAEVETKYHSLLDDGLGCVHTSPLDLWFEAGKQIETIDYNMKVLKYHEVVKQALSKDDTYLLLNLAYINAHTDIEQKAFSIVHQDDLDKRGVLASMMQENLLATLSSISSIEIETPWGIMGLPFSASQVEALVRIKKQLEEDFLSQWEQHPEPVLSLPQYPIYHLWDCYFNEKVLKDCQKAYEKLKVGVFNQINKFCDLLEELFQPNMQSSLTALSQLSGKNPHCITEYEEELDAIQKAISEVL